jgi:hypothetical protein
MDVPFSTPEANMLIYKIVTLDDVLAQVSDQTELCCDTETIGLYGKIRTIQFFQRHWEYVLIVERPEPIDLLLFFSKIKKVKTAYQGSAYDISTMQDNFGSRWAPDEWIDIMYLARLAYPTMEGQTLDEIFTTVLGYDPYAKAGINKPAMQKSNWDVFVLSDQQLTYAALDVYHMPEVIDKAGDFQEDMNYKLDMLATKYGLDFQRNGFPVIQSACEAQYRQNKRELQELAIPINVNSYKQVPDYCNTEKADALTLGIAALQGNTRARDVLKAKKLSKQLSFLDKFLTDDGHIYGKFAPLARSGRFTCKDQNLQQLPRKLKHCFGYEKGSGKVILYADYPQLELRTIAAIVREKVLIELFKNNEDPHNYVAKLIFGENFTPEHRQVIKTYNFNLLYCGGAEMIQSILIKDNETWRELDLIHREIRQWKKTWKGIADWQQQTIRSHRRGSLKETPMGRRYRGKLLTDHANIENQGFGAEIAKLAMHYMYDDLKANNAPLINFVHDSFTVSMDEDYESNMRVAKLMKEAMQEAWFEGCKLVEVKDIPMPAQVFCGYNWKTVEKEPIFKV